MDCVSNVINALTCGARAAEPTIIIIPMQSTHWWDKRAVKSIQQQWIVQHSNANAVRNLIWDSEVVTSNADLNWTRKVRCGVLRDVACKFSGEHKLPTDSNNIKIRNCVVDNEALVMRCISESVLGSCATSCNNWQMNHFTSRQCVTKYVKITVLLSRHFDAMKIKLNIGSDDLV